MFKQNNYIEKKNFLQGSENRYSEKYVVFMVLKMSLFVMSSVKQNKRPSICKLHNNIMRESK